MGRKKLCSQNFAGKMYFLFIQFVDEFAARENNFLSLCCSENGITTILKRVIWNMEKKFSYLNRECISVPLNQANSAMNVKLEKSWKRLLNYLKLKGFSLQRGH